MPFYEFECESCGCVFDVKVSIQEKEAGLKAECPQCRSPKNHQVITAGAVMRGGGKAGSSGSSGSCCGPNSGRGCCG
jgi:putative FmdB family regulatory protein